MLYRNDLTQNAKKKSFCKKPAGSFKSICAAAYQTLHLVEVHLLVSLYLLILPVISYFAAYLCRSNPVILDLQNNVAVNVQNLSRTTSPLEISQIRIS